MTAKPERKIETILIDAGVDTLKIEAVDSTGVSLRSWTLRSDAGLEASLAQIGLDSLGESVPIYITGKLRMTVRRFLGRGELILPSAAMWAALRARVEAEPLAVLELIAQFLVAKENKGFDIGIPDWAYLWGSKA